MDTLSGGVGLHQLSFFSTIIVHEYLDQKIAFFQAKNVDLQDLLVYLVFSCYIYIFTFI